MTLREERAEDATQYTVEIACMESSSFSANSWGSASNDSVNRASNRVAQCEADRNVDAKVSTWGDIPRREAVVVVVVVVVVVSPKQTGG